LFSSGFASDETETVFFPPHVRNRAVRNGTEGREKDPLPRYPDLGGYLSGADQMFSETGPWRKESFAV
jgi:hypothetical protein